MNVGSIKVMNLITSGSKLNYKRINETNVVFLFKKINNRKLYERQNSPISFP